MPFLCAMKDGQKGRGSRRGVNEGAGEKNSEEERERRKLFSLYFPFKDILTGQSPVCGSEWSHFEVSYRQLETSEEPE